MTMNFGKTVRIGHEVVVRVARLSGVIVSGTVAGSAQEREVVDVGAAPLHLYEQIKLSPAHIGQKHGQPVKIWFLLGKAWITGEADEVVEVLMESTHEFLRPRQADQGDGGIRACGSQ